MTKEQFQNQQKAEMQIRYAALKALKTKRLEAYSIIAKENNMSQYTVKAILFTQKYRKSSIKTKNT